MDSRIVDPEYLHYQTLRKYDTIIAHCVGLFFSLKKEKGIKIEYKEDIEHKFLFNIVKICNTAAAIPVYLDTDWRTYRKIKKQNPTYTIKWMISRVDPPITPKFVLCSIQGAFPDVSNNIMREIYNEYWIESEVK